MILILKHVWYGPYKLIQGSIYKPIQYALADDH